MTKLNQLCEWFENKGRILVALSGGIDSALVAYAAYKKLGEQAIAITADYNTLSQEELDSAKKICKEIGIKHEIMVYDELANDKFVKNDSNRCFYCRAELATRLVKLTKQLNADLIVDGTNLDDLGDFRPGIKAMKDNGIKSPLVEIGFTKREVRKVAMKAGLSIFGKPSNSCLASRIPWGQRVTKERLVRIELGEFLIKNLVGAKQVRVRDIDGSAKIELAPKELNLLSNESILQEIIKKLKLLGFSSVTVDPLGYKPGKINVIAD